MDELSQKPGLHVLYCQRHAELILGQILLNILIHHVVFIEVHLSAYV
jgi:hypothetical protein